MSEDGNAKEFEKIRKRKRPQAPDDGEEESSVTTVKRAAIAPVRQDASDGGDGDNNDEEDVKRCESCYTTIPMLHWVRGSSRPEAVRCSDCELPSEAIPGQENQPRMSPQAAPPVNHDYSSLGVEKRVESVKRLAALEAQLQQAHLRVTQAEASARYERRERQRLEQQLADAAASDEGAPVSFPLDTQSKELIQTGESSTKKKPPIKTTQVDNIDPSNTGSLASTSWTSDQGALAPDDMGTYVPDKRRWVPVASNDGEEITDANR